MTQVLVDSNGSSFTEGVLTGTIEIPDDGELTFYARHGELFAKLCGCDVLVFSSCNRLPSSLGENRSPNE